MGIGALVPLGYFVAIAYVTMAAFILVIMGTLNDEEKLGNWAEI